MRSTRAVIQEANFDQQREFRRFATFTTDLCLREMQDIHVAKEDAEQDRSSFEKYCTELLNPNRWNSSRIDSEADSSEIASFHTAPESPKEMHALTQTAIPREEPYSMAGPGPRTQEYLDALRNPVHWGLSGTGKTRGGGSKDDCKWKSVPNFWSEPKGISIDVEKQRGRADGGNEDHSS